MEDSQMHRSPNRSRLTLTLIALLLLGLASVAGAETYRVSFTNMTYNQIISPPVVATHNFAVRLFNEGRPASDALGALAEDADSSGLLAFLDGSDLVFDHAIGEGVIMPGQTVTVTVEAGEGFDRLSAVGMLVTTNDSFFGLSNAVIDTGERVRNLYANAYDSGTETNNEDCAFIPGPPCGNPFQRATPGEGFVHIHRGIHGVGDLAASSWDWRNPVVRITLVKE